MEYQTEPGQSILNSDTRLWGKAFAVLKAG